MSAILGFHKQVLAQVFFPLLNSVIRKGGMEVTEKVKINSCQRYQCLRKYWFILILM